MAQPEYLAAEVYVVRSDRKWKYIDQFTSDELMVSEYMIIRQDDVTDMLTLLVDWRFGEPFDVFPGTLMAMKSLDLAPVRYTGSGTFCLLIELVVYKQVDGHYQSYFLDSSRVLNDIAQWGERQGKPFGHGERQ